MRKYRVSYGGAEWDAKEGDVIELELDAQTELELVDAGRLEIEPAEYKVIGNQEVYGAARGETFTAAMPIANEAALLSGYHVERVDPEPKKTKATAKREEESK